MSTLYVDTITEKTSGNGVQISDLVPAAGSVVQVAQWNVTPIAIGTGGSWAATTVPTIANTYSSKHLQ